MFAKDKNDKSDNPENIPVVISEIAFPLKSSVRKPVYAAKDPVCIAVIHLSERSHSLSVEIHPKDAIFPLLSSIAKTGEITNDNSPITNQTLIFVFCIGEER